MGFPFPSVGESNATSTNALWHFLATGRVENEAALVAETPAASFPLAQHTTAVDPNAEILHEYSDQTVISRLTRAQQVQLLRDEQRRRNDVRSRHRVAIVCSAQDRPSALLKIGRSVV